MDHDFDGETYEPGEDKIRLNTQLDRVLYVTHDGRWMTLDQIQAEIEKNFSVKYSTAGISARLRDFRKERFGALTVERRRVDGGLWEYQVSA